MQKTGDPAGAGLGNRNEAAVGVQQPYTIAF